MPNFSNYTIVNGNTCYCFLSPSQTFSICFGEMLVELNTFLLTFCIQGERCRGFCRKPVSDEDLVPRKSCCYLHALTEFVDNFLLVHVQIFLEGLQGAVTRDVLDLPEGPTVPIQLRQLGSTEGVG